jgi:hypothetical protein
MATVTPYRAGFHGDFSVNTGYGNYLGNADDATLSSLLGKTLDISTDELAVGAGVWASLGDDNRVNWIGFSAGIGPGIGASAGLGTTYYLGGFKWEK